MAYLIDTSILARLANAEFGLHGIWIIRMTSNPYAAPQSDRESARDINVKNANSQTCSKLDLYMVRIHHLMGINLLGVLLLLGMAFGMVGASEVSSHIQNRFVDGLLHLSIVVAPAVADISWRWLRASGTIRQRLFSPFKGGSFLYLPIWGVLTAMQCFVGLSILAHWFSKP